VRGDRTRYLRNIQHAFLAFLDEQLHQLVPDPLSAFSYRRQKGIVSFIRRVVLLNEITDIDFLLPQVLRKTFPTAG
jgi:hypothetical protein